MTELDILYISLGLNIGLIWHNRTLWRKHIELSTTMLRLLFVMKSIADLESVATRDGEGNIIIKSLKEIPDGN
jgi:hypothetical protein